MDDKCKKCGVKPPVGLVWKKQGRLAYKFRRCLCGEVIISEHPNYPNPSGEKVVETPTQAMIDLYPYVLGQQKASE